MPLRRALAGPRERPHADARRHPVPSRPRLSRVHSSGPKLLKRVRYPAKWTRKRNRKTLQPKLGREAEARRRSSGTAAQRTCVNALVLLERDADLAREEARQQYEPNCVRTRVTERILAALHGKNHVLSR